MVVSNKTTMATDAENYTENEACLKITYKHRVSQGKIERVKYIYKQWLLHNQLFIYIYNKINIVYQQFIETFHIGHWGLLTVYS